ncbi:4-hydroxybenzoyl-CoA thioesterase [Caldimonas brevitalea]|uniref:4-hydroxybenzoyl-CoA thioesterase n=1 Tax=Caldimonas brevitalea TaxID=413882 RepID=A0A0G3BPZ7_9BURK|nr:thioesterase family protein [Caldimonas brevitalea]AKJ28635.1 4-hydroxybenzoyl-CoA thioesterase [Caldimonas brevitalea]
MGPHAFERPVQIRFSHCDPAGIVFFPQYLVMLQNLIEDWFTEGLGQPYAELLGPRRLGLPTVSLACEFAAPSRLGDQVMLGLTLDRITACSIELSLGCRCGEQQRMRARQTLVTAALDGQRAVPIPDDVREALERFLQQQPVSR